MSKRPKGQAKNPNTNCLDGMACPACGAFGPFSIDITTVARVFDDGVDEIGDKEWEDGSMCQCSDCCHMATVGEFKGEPPPPGVISQGAAVELIAAMEGLFPFAEDAGEAKAAFDRAVVALNAAKAEQARETDKETSHA